ncbi:hypothetical protein FRB96_003990 [Tulasnella sp. 330]|nr:hypothetical protein FRB96_003990 [Tulasnella sp. 330]
MRTQSEPLEAEAETTEISKRGIELLTPNSAFFGILWPVIIKQADSNTRIRLLKTCSWFASVVSLQGALEVRRQYLQFIGPTTLHPSPHSLRLGKEDLWWYFACEMDPPRKHDDEVFQELCRIAGIKRGGAKWHQEEDGPEFVYHFNWFKQKPRYSLLSESGDAHLTCLKDPKQDSSDQRTFWICIGAYETVKRLFEFLLGIQGPKGSCTHCSWRAMFVPCNRTPKEQDNVKQNREPELGSVSGLEFESGQCDSLTV